MPDLSTPSGLAAFRESLPTVPRDLVPTYPVVWWSQTNGVRSSTRTASVAFDVDGRTACVEIHRALWSQEAPTVTVNWIDATAVYPLGDDDFAATLAVDARHVLAAHGIALP